MKFNIEGKVLSFEVNGEKYELSSKADFVKSPQIKFPYSPTFGGFEIGELKCVCSGFIVDKSIFDKQEPHKHQEFIDGYKHGKKIQTRYGENSKWQDTHYPAWLEDFEYRFKPETIECYKCGDTFSLGGRVHMLCTHKEYSMAFIEMESGRAELMFKDIKIKHNMTDAFGNRLYTLDDLKILSYYPIKPLAEPTIVEL